jgi:signal transduction histidine kinase
MSTQKTKNQRTSGSIERLPLPSAGEKGMEPCEYFEAAKLGELLLGIIHNLSTPLSGVLGGVQLLEMRSLSIAEALEKLDDLSDNTKRQLLDHLECNQKSIELISRNAQNLSTLVQNLSTRMTRFSIKTPDIYGLNQLIEMELRYLEFHLTFKHRVRRQITLGNDLPPMRCVFSRFARGFDEIIYTAMEQEGSKKNSLLEIAIKTMAEPDRLVLSLDCSVDSACFEEKLSSSSDCHNAVLPYYFYQLQEDGWKIDMRPSDLGTEFLLKHAPIHLASHR